MAKLHGPPPASRRKTSSPSPSYGKIFLYLVAFLLIKIGQTPQAVLAAFLRLFPFPFSLCTFSKKRGRPRLKSRSNFYLDKARNNLSRLFPKKKRFKIAAGLVVLLFLFYSQLIVRLSTQLPSPSRLSFAERPATTQFLDRDGRLLYQLYEGRNRELVGLEKLPQSLINATVAIEDKHFFNHPGIDPIGMLRALRINLANNDQFFDGWQGGSTITQQLIKNTLLSADKTLSRKAKEIILAFWAERVYSKNEILQMYFNEAPYGGPAWGVEAAAQMYFGKRAEDLNLAESAYLAGLPAAPTQYSPFGTNPEKGKERQKEVLRRMVEDKYISQTEASAAFARELTFRSSTIDIKAPHFVMYARSLLAAKYGERTVSQGGLKVITTLNLDLQKMAEEVVSEQVQKLAPLGVGNGAAMITDAKTGQILTMVGSKDYFEPVGGNFNATLALRPPGSSIKPITYATAFKEDFTPGTIVLDTPITFPNPWGRPYSPGNYDGKFHGPVTLRTALASSYNVPAVKILSLVGLPKMIETAREMGITTFTKPENFGLSLTLGGGDTRMIDMMSVYGVLAAGGIKYTPEAILTVTDSYGNILEDNRFPEGKRVLSEEVSYLLADILSDNKARIPAFGLNSLLEIPGYTVAVKTGTSDNKRDNLTFGFTPEFVVGAWVGNFDNSPMNPLLTSGITGATPIWHDIMAKLLQGRPNLAFKRPPGIVEVTLNGHKDLGILGQIPKKERRSGAFASDKTQATQ